MQGHPDFDKYDTGSLRTGIMAGAPCPVETMNQVRTRMHCQEVVIAFGEVHITPFRPIRTKAAGFTTAAFYILVDRARRPSQSSKSSDTANTLLRQIMNIIREKHSRLDDIRTVAIIADPACREGWEKNFPPMLDKVWKEHAPQLFIVAGDLALNALESEYRTILAYINRFPAYWAAVPGDHDRPLALFMKYFGATRKTVDVGRWRFIGINTSNRMFPAREEKWIADNIRDNSIIFSHLPPGVEGWTFHSLWPGSSARFLDAVKRHRKKIHSMYFGHIHGYSKRAFRGIPMVVTGALAESFAVTDNAYRGRSFFEMVIFDVKTGRTRLCTSS